MVSAVTRNVLGGMCLTCLLCGVFVMWSGPQSANEINADTIVLSAYGGEQHSPVMSTNMQATKKISSSGKTSKSDVKQKNSKLSKSVSKITEKSKVIDVVASKVVTDAIDTDSDGSSSSSSSSSTVTISTTTSNSNVVKTPRSKASPSHNKQMSAPANANPADPDDITFQMDYELDSDIGKMLRKRREYIYKTCTEHKKEVALSYVSTMERLRKQKKTNKNILTSDDKALNFCIVAKSGSTFWKAVFGYVGTGKIVEGLKAPKILRKTGTGRYRSLYDMEDDMFKEENYTTFVAVRNPWKRLVSLYQQKIEEFLPILATLNTSRINFHNYDMSPYKYMLNVCNAKHKDLRTFEDMLMCVLAKSIRQKPNRHWESAYEYCDICNVSFDYIIRTENMMKEGTHVLEQAGFKNAADVLNDVRTGTIRDVEKHKKRQYSDYYRDINPDYIQALRQMYKWEIQLFKYPNTPFIN